MIQKVQAAKTQQEINQINLELATLTPNLHTENDAALAEAQSAPMVAQINSYNPLATQMMTDCNNFP